MIAQLARGEADAYMWEVRPDEDARGGLFWFGETENARIVVTPSSSAGSSLRGKIELKFPK